jgi:hypothetical protein
MLAMKNFFSLSVCACQKYGLPRVTMKPVSPAHSRLLAPTCGPVKDSMWLRSSMFHVLPTEKVPFGFSLDLCMRTRPDLRTAMMMTRGFSDSGVRACGGGGAAGCDENSVMRIWVMYVSWTIAVSCQLVPSRRQSIKGRQGRFLQRPRGSGGRIATYASHRDPSYRSSSR